jgi:hypothetical protein
MEISGMGAAGRLVLSDKPVLVSGRKQIASVLGVSDFLLSQFLKDKSFPVCRMTPEGTYFTTKDLLKDWAERTIRGSIPAQKSEESPDRPCQP